MKSFIFALVTVLCSSNAAYALDGLRMQAFVYSPEYRYERADDQSLAQRKPINYAASIRKGMFSGLLEFSNFKTDSGNVLLNISREHREYLIWGRVHVISYEQAPYFLSLFVGAGAGTYQETLVTALNSSVTTDVGKYEAEGGLVLGGDGVYTFANDFGLVVGAEMRLLFGKQFDPNPQFSGLVRIGFQF